MDPMTPGQLKDMLGGVAVVGVFAGVFAWCTYLASTIYRRKQKNDMQKHMLDKFSSTQDFAEFVQSPAGQKYVMSFSETVTDSRDTILNSLRTGIILFFVGAGLDTANFGVGSYTTSWLHVAGNVLIMTGTGFVIAAVVARFVAKRMKTGEKE
jgi:hypothetical protein